MWVTQVLHLQDNRCSTQRDKQFYSSYCIDLITKAPILKVVSFRRVHGSDIEWLYMCYLKTVYCPLPSDRPPKSSWWSPLSQLVNFASSQHLVTTMSNGSQQAYCPKTIKWWPCWCPTYMKISIFCSDKKARGLNTDVFFFKFAMRPEIKRKWCIVFGWFELNHE